MHKGTTFHIYLPLAELVAGGQRVHVSEARGGTETLLVAEDDGSVRSIICEILRRYGYTVIEAVDGQDAVERFADNRIDLLILDSVMPKMNGRETYEKIKKIRPDAKALFMSGYTRDIILTKGIQDGEFKFIPKPVTPIMLLQATREALDGWKAGSGE